MKILPLCLCVSLGFLHGAFAAGQTVIAEDDASSSEYGSGWESGKGSGSFGKWNLQTTTAGGDTSHAGFYIADGSKPDLNGIATHGKAFGMYANGTGFEAAVAFRNFDKPLQVGQSFSFQMEHGEIVKKFETDDPNGGSIGITLRTSTNATSANDYNHDVRWEFGFYKSVASNGYVVYDADGSKTLDIPFTDAGMNVTFTLVTADTYTLEVTTLADKKTVKLPARKLSGAPGTPITGFCLFDRNGETNDAYFNGFQVLQPK